MANNAEAGYQDLDPSDPEYKRLRNKRIQKWIMIVLLNIFVVCYFAYATFHHIQITDDACKKNPNSRELCGIQYCDGYGLLLIMFICGYIGLFYYSIFKPMFGINIYNERIQPKIESMKEYTAKRSVTIAIFLIWLVCFAAFLIFEMHTEPDKLQCLSGPIAIVVIGFIFCPHRANIKWTTVISGITCQFLLGVMCLRWSVGRQIFNCIGNKLATYLSFSNEGSQFIYGHDLVSSIIFAFAILPVIFFFSFTISILYYMNVMQFVITKLGWMLQKILGTTVCESVNASANIFLSMSESPLIIRPYIDLLTRSEIHAVMVSGFCTVSGTVMAAYLSFGASAANLITASVMAAPGSLALSKLYYPEIEESLTSSEVIQLAPSEDSSILDAAAHGASLAIPIVLGITANIVAFVGCIAFLNALVNWLSLLVGLFDINFMWLLSKIFMPLAWSMGIPWKECETIGRVISIKTIINEFVAFKELGEFFRDGLINKRSNAIATFAICGFANPGSLGILIGSLSAMAPAKRPDVTAVAVRSFIVGSCVSFISASFAGILLNE